MWRSGDWLRRLRRCLSRYSTGTVADQKRDSPQQYVEVSRGKPTSRHAAEPQAGLSQWCIGGCSGSGHDSWGQGRMTSPKLSKNRLGGIAEIPPSANNCA
jgi:hypothetical protein